MDMVERVARAIQEADDACSFSMKLIRLVDGVSTYSLRYGDGMYLEFEDQDELYEHVRQRKAQARARAVIGAMRESSQDDVELFEACQPFADLKAQNGAWGVINKRLDGLQPVQVTVTKNQMCRLLTVLSCIRRARNGGTDAA